MLILRQTSVLSVFLLVLSCSEQETVFEYPDCISEPNNLTESFGCSNVFAYQFLDSTRVLTVRINSSNVDLTEECQTFTLSEDNTDISVTLEIAGDDPDSIYFNYCNDVGYPNFGTTTVYAAITGQLTFSVSEDDPIKEPIWDNFYYIAIKIEDLHLFHQKSGAEIVINEIIFWNVGVGWLPG